MREELLHLFELNRNKGYFNPEELADAVLKLFEKWESERPPKANTTWRAV